MGKTTDHAEIDRRLGNYRLSGRAERAVEQHRVQTFPAWFQPDRRFQKMAEPVPLRGTKSKHGQTTSVD